MAQTNINIRMDSDLKASFSQFCDNIGISMTSAICLFAKQAVAKQKIPFEITADPFYSDKNTAFLKNSISQLEQGETVTKSLDELEAMENA